MTPPDPRRLLAIVANKRQGLGIVDDDDVVVEMVAGGVLEGDLFVDL